MFRFEKARSERSTFNFDVYKLISKLNDVLVISIKPLLYMGKLLGQF